MRHHLTSIKTDTIKKKKLKQTENNNPDEEGELLEPVHCWWESKMVTASVGGVEDGGASRKFKNRNDQIQQFHFWVPKRNESRSSKRYPHTRIHSSSIHGSQNAETTQVPINR